MGRWYPEKGWVSLAQEGAPGSSVPLANGDSQHRVPTHQLLGNFVWEWKLDEFFLPSQALRCFPQAPARCLAAIPASLGAQLPMQLPHLPPPPHLHRDPSYNVKLEHFWTTGTAQAEPAISWLIKT